MFAKLLAKIVSLLGAHLNFLKSAFSDNGLPSSSRLLLVPHCITACFVLVYVALKTHGVPDGMTLTGLGGFATAPYAVNRVSNMFGKKDDPDKDKSNGAG